MFVGGGAYFTSPSAGTVVPFEQAYQVRILVLIGDG